MDYRRRVLDSLLDEVMPDLAAIAIEGAKGVGKTMTATQRATSVVALDDAEQRAAIESSPRIVSRLAPPVLIYE